MADPLLASMVHALGMETARHYTVAAPKIQAYRDSWLKLAPFRDGPINPKRTEVSDSEAMTKQIKAKATDLGADRVGVCRLQPHIIDLGADVPRWGSDHEVLVFHDAVTPSDGKSVAGLRP